MCFDDGGVVDELGSQLTGKVTNNAGMHEKGELRESGGKAAAQGQTRGPHD